MATITSDNEYDSSRAGQGSASAQDGGYGEHQNNGQGKHRTALAMAIDCFPIGYSQGGGNAGAGAKPEDERKLFVGKIPLRRRRIRCSLRFDSPSGGLTWDTTQDDLREYFAKFGTVVDCSIKQDPLTGRSRGFAFLVFDSKDIVEQILSQNDHFVKGRKVDPKPAHRRTAANNNQMSNNNSHHHHSASSQSSYGGGQSSAAPYGNTGMGANANAYNNNRKVFIGGLDPSFPDSQLREYFSKFGKIDGKTSRCSFVPPSLIVRCL